MRILHLFICTWAVVSYLNDGLVTAAAVGVVHTLAYVALNACIFHNITSHRWYYSLCRFCRFIRAFSNQNFYNFKGCRAACLDKIMVFCMLWNLKKMLDFFISYMILLVYIPIQLLRGAIIEKKQQWDKEKNPDRMRPSFFGAGV